MGGCCQVRPRSIFSESVYNYLKDSKLWKVKAHKAYEVIHSHKFISKDLYLEISKKLNVTAPFEIFTTASQVSAKRLITALVILGKDKPENKLEVLDKLAKRNSRSVMAYYELQNELLLLRIPICAAGQGLVQLDKAQRFTINSRAKAGTQAAIAYAETEGDLAKAVARTLPEIAD